VLAQLKEEKKNQNSIGNMYQNIGEVITPGVKTGKMIVYGKRKNAQGVKVILRDILTENDLKVLGSKCSDILIVSYIVVIVPVGKLIADCVPETHKCHDTDKNKNNSLLN
jgi:hypothetical protein